MSRRSRPSEEVVVKHHHRADFETQEARDLAVLWRAPVVTTAVRFFETLASNQPGYLRKLHALLGSAMFIDEAHAALPAHLRPQNWRWLRELAERWNCRFVFASGSLARFWENPDIDQPDLSGPSSMRGSGVWASHVAVAGHDGKRPDWG